MPPFCIILGRKPPLIDLLYRLDRSVTALRSLTSDHGSPPHRPQLSYDDAPVMSGSPNPAERTSSPVMVEQEGGGGVNIQQQPHLATLPRVMKRPADPLHPVAPIFQPNEGAGRGG